MLWAVWLGRLGGRVSVVGSVNGAAGGRVSGVGTVAGQLGSVAGYLAA